MLSPRDRLAVALDVSTLAEASALARRLAPEVGVLKVGLELFVAEGPAAVRAVHDAGSACFLDLKLHDIPATVAGAVLASVRSAGRAALRDGPAAAGLGPRGRRRGGRGGCTQLLAVHRADLIDAGALRAISHDPGRATSSGGWPPSPLEVGITGFVCSAHEAALLRDLAGREATLVTPGVRPGDADKADQRRVATPAQAIRAGADVLVVGRPVRQAPDPAAAARHRGRDRGSGLVKRVVVGPRAVVEAVRAAAGRVNVVFIARDGRRALREVADEVARRGVRLEEREPAELDALARGHKHQGVVAITGEYVYAELGQTLAAAASPPLLVALDQITDPHNLGAIVRSAVAFGADGVLTLKNRAAPVTPVVVRASAGATEHARIVRVTNLARTLAASSDQGMDAIGLDAEGDLDMDDLPPAPGGA
ncbi:MAG: orotidine 5'-phosphate decarboxylase / HUMPS family protein [Sandaracinaceae bacterium]